MAIQIDTGAVRAAAQCVQNENRKINREFEALSRKISEMNRNWDGNGSNNAIRLFDNINRVNDSRSQVMSSFADFMNRQVGHGYETTESNITSAADAFK